ncbi:hypothetical protein D3P07_17590 [Paenibacillus sp. 1011MAR3C5]|uniref:hypothetical protein n=1 Tax=Paenibacillus sp. 1011MAR3C5 TaxID=1675787 RepID=UPI000E6C0E1E|nr:hypothetical protein [Paenibacillus sp. 1011MAR3C5]RJE86988.1 hypothetical protein D3P07_17590 [Paenibacillus sp. 1011MAR3C5]
MSNPINRIISQLGDDLLQKLKGLSPSDFNSLMLEVYRTRTDALRPSDVLRSYASSRFSKPSELDPVAYHQLEADLLGLARQQDIEPVLLSPVAPLGNCSIYGTVDQNKIVSASRGTEVLADSTNMMATIAADRIKQGIGNHDEGAHLCSTHRVVRAQHFNGPGSFAHFGIYGMVSVGKAKGSYQCEANLLGKQLGYYQALFRSRFRAELSIVLEQRSGYADGAGFLTRMAAIIKEQLPDASITIQEPNVANSYYQGINFKLFMTNQHGKTEIGDGGFVDWTQSMLGNQKERCLISGIGLDRLLIMEL